MSADTVTVKVLPGWAVFDGTEQRGEGSVLHVDAATAAIWIAAGWVASTAARVVGSRKPPSAT